MALFASAAGYPIGWLADRFGRRLILGICIVVWSISTAACAFQYSYFGLFATTAGIAIGEAALGPIIFSMLPDLFPERQRNTANFIFFRRDPAGRGRGPGARRRDAQLAGDPSADAPRLPGDDRQLARPR